MGRILISGGGGVDLDVITAAADDILSGKVIVDQNGDPLTGVLTLSGNAGAGDVLTGKTFYNTNAKSKITGTMQTMSGGTYTPKSSQQTISCNGKKMTSDVIIKGDGNLTANNILYGKSIFGVSGNVRKYAYKGAATVNSSSSKLSFKESGGSTYSLYYCQVNNIGFTPILAVFFGSGYMTIASNDGSVNVEGPSGATGAGYYSKSANSNMSFTSSKILVPTAYPSASNPHWYMIAGYY